MAHDDDASVPSDSPMSARTEAAVILAIVALAAVLRLLFLGRDGLWADECQQLVAARMPLGDYLAHLADHHQAPLYFVVTRLFVLLDNHVSESLTRISSALVGTLTVALAWRTGRDLGGARVGVVAAFLLATSPLHIHYSREARDYAILCFGILVVTHALVLLARAPTVVRALYLASGALVALYTHDIAPAYAAGAAVAALISLHRSDRRAALLKSYALALVVVVVGYLPWLSTFSHRVGNIAIEYAWLAPTFAQEFPWQIARSFAALSHGSAAPLRNHVREIDAMVFPDLLISTALIVAALVRRRMSLRDAGMLASIAFVPLVIIFVFSLVRAPVYVVGRIDAPALAPVLLLVALALRDTAPRIVIAVSLGLAAIAGPSIADELLVDTRSQERSIARLLSAQMSDGDILVVTGDFLDSMKLYVRDAKPSVDVRAFPRELEQHTFWVDWDRYRGDALKAEADAVASEIAKAKAAHVWVLLDGDERNHAIVDALGGPSATFELRYQRLRVVRVDRAVLTTPAW